MKKIFMVGLVICLVGMGASMAGAEQAGACGSRWVMAGGGNGGGYGKTEETEPSSILAGSGNGGGYGKTDEGVCNLIMAGGVNGGGYGNSDAGRGAAVLAGMAG